MPVVYLKPHQVSKMTRHFGNLQNSLLRHFQTYLGTFNNIQPCSDIMRDMANLPIFSHI